MIDNPVEFLKEKSANFSALKLELEASVPYRDMKLRDIASLQPGDVLRLPARPRSPIFLRLNGKPFATADLAQINGKYAVRLVPDPILVKGS